MQSDPGAASVSERACARLGPALIAAAALAAYAGGFRGVFLFDDIPGILGNPTLRHLWPLWLPLNPPAGALTVSGRPILNLSLALNYAVSGEAVWSYHALNLLIHVCAGLALFGVVRRTLRGPGAARAALAAALLWTVHPLQTESVTYIVQRGESLMGMFYLLTVYFFVRGIQGESPSYAPLRGAMEGEKTGQAGCCWWWFGLSWLACLFGMGTKEVMVSAPLIVLLYDRTFRAGSFREAWRRHRGYYLSLAGTWLLLAVLVARNGSRGGTSGVGTGVGFWQYAQTQFQAVAQYLRLCFWPHPLIADYGVRWAAGISDVAPYAVGIGALAVATVVAVWRRWPTGFLGAWFFAILAPTSLIPGNRQTLAEHRMYLPLAAVIALVVCGGAWLLEESARLSGLRLKIPWLAVAAAAAIGLGAISFRRTEDYRSEEALWRVTVADRPGNAYAHVGLGAALIKQGRTREAMAEFRTALSIDADLVPALNDLGAVLSDQDRPAEAAAFYERALRRDPEDLRARINLGNVLRRLGRNDEALAVFRTALQARPETAEYNVALGGGFAALSRFPEAETCYAAALRWNPSDAGARQGLGDIRRRQGRMPEAIDQYEAALRFGADQPELHNDLGFVLCQAGRAPEAIPQLEAALRLKPGYPEAHNNLGFAFVSLGRLDDAIGQYREALRLRPDYAEAHDNLGIVLGRSGRVADSIPEFEAALRINPDLIDARRNLAVSLWKMGRTVEAETQLAEARRLQATTAGRP